MSSKFVLALYYTVADMALIWQVIYYQRQKQMEEEVYPGENSGLIGSSSLPTYDSTNTSATNKNQSKKTKLFNWTSATAIVLVTAISCYTYYNAHWKNNDNGGDDSNRLDWLPQTMGWTSAGLYVGSRIPQILKNWEHKSTEGLSFGMFICAVLGNVLFTSVSFFSIFKQVTVKLISCLFVTVHIFEINREKLHSYESVLDSWKYWYLDI